MLGLSIPRMCNENSCGTWFLKPAWPPISISRSPDSPGMNSIDEVAQVYTQMDFLFNLGR